MQTILKAPAPVRWVLSQALLCSPSELYFPSFLDPCMGTPLLANQWIENHLVYHEFLLSELSLILWYQFLARKIDDNCLEFYVAHNCISKLQLNFILSLFTFTSQKNKLTHKNTSQCLDLVFLSKEHYLWMLGCSDTCHMSYSLSQSEHRLYMALESPWACKRGCWSRG